MASRWGRLRGDRVAARRAAADAGVVLGIAMIGAGFLLAVATPGLGGLWLALVGWYLAQSAGAAVAYVRLIGDLGVLPVGRLMSSPAVCGYAGQSVSSFVAGVAATHPHHCYPIVDLDGHLAGAVTTRALAAVSPSQRHEVRLAKILIPVARLRVAQRETLIAEPSALPTNPLWLTVVLDGTRPCGVLTAGDLSRALAVARLGEAPDRSSGRLSDPIGWR